MQDQDQAHDHFYFILSHVIQAHLKGSLWGGNYHNIQDLLHEHI